MCPGPGPHSPGSRHVPHPAQPHAHKHTPAVSQARTRHTQSTHSHKLTSSRAPHCVRLGHTELLSAPQTGLPWAFTHTHTRTHTCAHTQVHTHAFMHTQTGTHTHTWPSVLLEHSQDWRFPRTSPRQPCTPTALVRPPHRFRQPFCCQDPALLHCPRHTRPPEP